MIRNSQLIIAATLMSVALIGNRCCAQYAASVVSYDAGTTPASGFTMPSAALGEPERFTGEGGFPSVVSPFNPPFRTNEIVSVGESGHITLRLSHYVIPQPGTPEIGVFENVGIVETDFPNGQAGTPAAAFGIDSAQVEVSADGSTWMSLGNVLFDVPTSGYTDLSNPFSETPGSALSDFQQPFLGSLSSFDGLRYSNPGGPDMLELLAGSGGGKWLDISATGLAQVGFIRFSVADNGNPDVGLNFELDAVSIAGAALGAPVVPEPASITLSALVLLTVAALRLPTRAQIRQTE